MRVNRIGLATLLLVASLAAAGAPLKFLTFNIWGDYFGNPVEERAAGVEATILKGRPDVVVLQEVTPGWYGSALFANLGKAGYALVRGDEDAALKRAAFCGEKTPKHINHEPLLYRTDRLKLLDSGTDFFHLSLTTSKSVTWAVLERTSDGRRFAAFATHFWWKGNGEESDAIRELNARHVLRVLADIRRKWDADLPAILGGDLNSTDASPAHAMLRSGGFVNAASHADVRSPRTASTTARAVPSRPTRPPTPSTTSSTPRASMRCGTKSSPTRRRWTSPTTRQFLSRSSLSRMMYMLSSDTGRNSSRRFPRSIPTLALLRIQIIVRRTT